MRASLADTVGPPMPGTLVKLVDIPLMGYFLRDNKGEVGVQQLLLAYSICRDWSRKPVASVSPFVAN